MSRGRVLIIDDEPDMLENMERLLQREGYQCRTMSDPLPARAVLRDFRPDVLLVDLVMPGADGLTILAAAQADDASLPVIMITAHATVQSAVQAMREGAFDYLAKPFTAEQLLVAVDRAAKYRGLAVENRVLREQVGRDGSLGAILGTSAALAAVLDQVRRAAPTDASVLITGESGTGKELMARGLHAGSARRDGPFIGVDCAAIPESLLESELFGHERGAFTGALERREGLLALAHGGTLLLDELGEMSPALQAKLLRVLEERRVRRLGGGDREIDVRFVAATNTDLEAAVKSGAFRADLYYRLNVVRLHVPPLRERREDIALLGRTFLERFAADCRRDPPRVAPEVWECLEAWDWPGNVRELRNLMQRLVVLDDDGRIARADLPENVRAAPVRVTEGSATPGASAYERASDGALRTFREAYLRRLLAERQGNVTRAAASAGVSRRTIHRWLADLKQPAGTTSS
jgi:DNA-binding NtrC family response regulator